MDLVPAVPGLQEGVDPFADPLIGKGFDNFPVVKIGNIPYSATKQEIAHFLGRDAQADMIDEFAHGTPIHIIMERSTSKTMDCYVEMKTYPAVIDQLKRHWDNATSGYNKHPRIGQRLVTVDRATQDELLKDMFPRAKCVRWEYGRPIILKNEDPYSTGFTGFFTNEEMVGLVRHAEHPNRSPFSMKCLQRTYECMISTIWKFPWAASSNYTIGDRNSLFVTYMKLLDVLVDKVDSNVVALGQQLLLDYLFAGLNCRGFGERQRGLIHVRGGRLAAPIQVQQIHSYWPFDVVGRDRRFPDEEYCKVYLNLTEQGVQALGPSELMPNFFIHAQGRLPNGRQPPIRNTHFEFNEKSQGLSFAAATEIEMQLMTKLLKAGYNVVNGVWPGTYQESQRQERMAEQRERDEMVNNSLRRSMERLRLNTEAVKKENQDESPPQSPKGSLALGESEPIHTPTTRLSPPRRQSEPKPFTGSLGANLDISPFRLTPPIGTNVSPMRSTPTSGSRAIPIKDPNKMHSTPTKAGRRPSFAVGDTIHEESENEDA